jgi:hypothetical protein
MMKNKYIIPLCFIAFVLIYCQKLSAQAQLIVTLTNNNTETFAVSEIRSIKFGAQTMNLRRNNGSVSTWNISEIANYRFEGVSGINETEKNIGKLQVFPNPMQEQTSIVFASQTHQHIRIQLLDILGRSVREIYSGPHEGEQTYTFQADVPKGLYLLRLIKDNGQLTQSILIQ